jgi:hypothetical protein
MAIATVIMIHYLLASTFFMREYWYVLGDFRIFIR